MLDANDKANLRLVAWKEARAEGLGAMICVMKICLNRVGKPGFAKILHDVIYGKNQFTSMSVPSDPEFNLDPAKALGADLESWNGSAYLADNVETTDDPTNGALYYENPKTSEDDGWFERNIAGADHQGVGEHKLLRVIGHHYFYS